MPRYIDVEAFIKEQCNSCDGACEALPCDCINCDSDCRCDMIKDLLNAPTISPDEVRGGGKWINKTMSVPNGHGQTYNRWGCSVCKAKSKTRTNYCPNCGAKMEVTSDA